MNIDEVLRDMEAFDNEGAEWMTPVQYAKIRPVQGPQVYGWMRTGKVSWKRCDCGRRVINVEEVDEYLRSKGKLPPAAREREDGEESNTDADN